MSSPSRPVTQLDKSDVLSGLFASWDAIDRVIGDLPEAQWSQPTSLPGWDVHDVVAHVIGTESMLQGVGTPEADVDVSTLKHVRNDIGVLNERWVRKLRGLSPAELLDSFRTTTAERRDALTAMGDAQWDELTATPAGPDIVRTVHAGAGLRLLDARTRHPRCAAGAGRRRRTSTGRTPGWRSTRWRRAWASSSASSAERPTGRGCGSN